MRDLGIRPSTAAWALQRWPRPAEWPVHDTPASAVIHLRLLAVPALVLRQRRAPRPRTQGCRAARAARRGRAVAARARGRAAVARCRAAEGAQQPPPAAVPPAAQRRVRGRRRRLGARAGRRRRSRPHGAAGCGSRAIRRPPPVNCSAPSATRTAKSSMTGCAAHASGSAALRRDAIAAAVAHEEACGHVARALDLRRAPGRRGPALRASAPAADAPALPSRRSFRGARRLRPLPAGPARRTGRASRAARRASSRS